MLYATRSDKELINLIKSDDWPQAVDPDLICHQDSHNDQVIRAEGILEFCVDEEIDNKKFLDFGCGEGFVAEQALERSASISVGFDIAPFQRKEIKAFCTNDWNKVREFAPFDVVLIYDVLDHCIENPVDLLLKIREVLQKSSTVYVRLHPWISRHGSHLYHDLNKAFLHLIAPKRLLKKIGAKELFTRQLNNPLEEYESWFENAGFDVVFKNVINEQVEEFFIDFEKDFKKKLNSDKFIDRLKICFVDYVLRLS